MDIFAFIFGCSPCFFFLERNFKIFRIEVAKISFTLRLLNYTRILKTYHLKDIFLFGVTKFAFLAKRSIYLYFFLKNVIFLFSLQPPNSSSEIINYHRLSCVKHRHSRQAIFRKSNCYFSFYFIYLFLPYKFTNTSCYY